MRKIFSIVGTAGGLGLLLVKYASAISNAFGIFSLPDDLKAALVVLSGIPTIIAWGALAVSLFCAGYLVVDSGHHTIALAAIKKRAPRVEPFHLIIFGLAIAAIGVGWQIYRGSYKAEISQEQIDKINAPLRTEIKNLQAALAKSVQPKSPQTRLANIEPPPAPKPKPYYEVEEINTMLKMLGQLRGIIDKECAPTYSDANSIIQSWNRLFREIGSAGLSNRLSGTRVNINDCWAHLTKVVSDNQHFRQEIFPTIADNNSAFAVASMLGELSNDLDVIAPAINIDVQRVSDRLFSPKLQALSVGLNNFGQWIGLATKRIEDKTKELREWRNQ